MAQSPSMRLILLLLILAGCSMPPDHQEGPYLSPDGQYELTATVNRTNADLPNYALVELTVYDKEQDRSTWLTTRIGDAQRWEVGWYNTDTIVAYSSDIGHVAWQFTGEGFLELELDQEMKKFALDLKDYSSDHQRR